MLRAKTSFRGDGRQATRPSFRGECPVLRVSWRQARPRLLESAHSEVQDIEFTVERGLLYFLQARSAKRTPQAAVKIAVDLVGEGVISRAQALERLASVDLAATRVGRFAAAAKAAAHATVASPGVACGRVCFDSLRARALADAGEPVILVRRRHQPGPHRGLRRRKRCLDRRRRSHVACGGRRPSDG